MDLPDEARYDLLARHGTPVAGVDVRILGDDGAELPWDGHAMGELQVRGPNVVQHYWPQRPAVDAEGWFHSGDLARQAADGSYSVVGRAKDMIISGGENIYPAEIENALAAHPDVAECAVLGVADARWGEAVVAAVVPRPGCRLDTEALQGHLQQRVARYKLPRRYVTLGTDGFGRSDTRAGLRDFFEVDAQAIAFAALCALHDDGSLDSSALAAAAAVLGWENRESMCPWQR